MPQPNPSAKVDYGCSYMLLWAVTMICLIAINRFMVELCLGVWQNDLPELMQHERVQLAFRTVTPLFLLIFEYWVWDFFRERLLAESNHRPGAPDHTPANATQHPRVSSAQRVANPDSAHSKTSTGGER